MSNSTKAVICLSLIVYPAATAAAQSPGASMQTAIEVCDPNGERAYIQQLVCPNGKVPEFQRVGSIGPRNPMTKEDSDNYLKNLNSGGVTWKPGEKDIHWIDEYELNCKGQPPQKILMDMYHCNVVNNPAPPAGLRMNINPDLLSARNARRDVPLSADAKKLVDDLLHCNWSMSIASKLPKEKNALAMRKLYPRLQIAALMIGVPGSYITEYGNAYRANLPTKPTMVDAGMISQRAEQCLASYSDRPELYLFDWESELMRKVYKD